MLRQGSRHQGIFLKSYTRNGDGLLGKLRGITRKRNVTECDGRGKDHCCWIYGETQDDRVECPWIEKHTVEGRLWACGLYREHGDWEKVYEDPRYLGSPVVQHGLENGHWNRCGDWPQSTVDGYLPREVACSGGCTFKVDPNQSTELVIAKAG